MEARRQREADISVVVPAWNRDSALTGCLRTLVAAGDVTRGAGLSTEIVVAAFRPSAELCRLANSFPRVRLVALMLDRWNLAAARNQGIAAARGRVVILLDADMLVGPGFLLQHYTIHAGARVLCVGAVNNYQTTATSRSQHASPAASPSNQVVVGECLDDVRSRLDFGLLPAPWAVAWTGNLSFERASVNEQFDEAMTGWGAEDLDWSRRAMTSLEMVIFREEAATWHQDHERDQLAAQHELANMERMFLKAVALDTEFVAAFGDIRGNLLLSQTLEDERATYRVGRQGRVGFFGTDRPGLDESYELVGVRTPWPPQSLTEVRVNHALLRLPEPMRGRLLREARRIARRVVVCGPSGAVHARSAHLGTSRSEN